MAEEPATGRRRDRGEIPDAVREWLSSVAADRGVSETELLQTLLTGGAADGGAPVADADIDRLEQEFHSLIEDVRERVIQVKREADAKAPADHTHHDLSGSLEQLGREIGALETEVERLDERLGSGFENYEDILAYLTDTTDELERRLGRLASVVIDLREQVNEAVRDEARRTALAHLTTTANRHGVEMAKCHDCGETVDVSLLVAPRCPHCDAAFSSLEPKRGFLRKAVLHTGEPPALESAPGAEKPAETGLATLVEGTAGATAGDTVVSAGPSPSSPATADESGSRQASGDGGEASATPGTAADDGEATADEGTADGTVELQAVDGIGPAYADRLQGAGIDGLRALAVADPEELGTAIDVSPSMVADWIEQAETWAGSS